jgi:hypothetical protein
MVRRFEKSSFLQAQDRAYNFGNMDFLSTAFVFVFRSAGACSLCACRVHICAAPETERTAGLRSAEVGQARLTGQSELRHDEKWLLEKPS